MEVKVYSRNGKQVGTMKMEIGAQKGQYWSKWSDFTLTK
jgi:hypothetical protein